MQKCLIFILIFFSLSVQARANWNPYVMDHERFVHLSEQDKRAVIISTMELMVELESQYKKEVKTSGFNQENYDKFVEALSKLSNFVLNSAIADDSGDKSLQELATEFSKLLVTLKGEGCVYGGYVSKMGKTSSGIRYCRHPSTMKDGNPKEAAIKKAYLNNGGACKAPNKISCNPVIFGYSPKDNTPFCVETGYLKTGKAHNVSYDCMREALKEDENKKSGVTVLQAAMSEFKAEKDNPFNAVHSFIFKTCACDDPSSINQGYVNYIKPHRTCFGMMNTLRVVKGNECEVINTVEHTKFADQWSQYFGKAEAFKELDPNADKTFDETYKSLIDQSAVKAICSGKIPVINVTPDPKDEKKWFCETECKEVATEADPATKQIVCTVKKSGWNIIKDGLAEESPAELATNEYTLTNAEQKQIDVTITKPIQSAEKCVVDFKKEEKTPTCSIDITDVEGDPTKSKAKVVFENPAKKKVVIKWSEEATSDTGPEDENTIIKTTEAKEINVTVTIEGEAPIICSPGTVPAIGADPSKDYGIKAKTAPVKPQDLNATVNATVQKTGEDKDLDEVPKGFHISWSREGATAVVKVVESDAAIKDTPVEENKDDKKEEKDKNADTDPKDPVVEAAPEIGKGPSISVPREKVAYKVCAQLIEDASEKSVAGPECDTIPALKEEAAKPAYNPGQNAPPPQFIMPVNNTRQMGIL